MEARIDGASHSDLEVFGRHQMASVIGMIAEADVERGVTVRHSLLLDDEPVAARSTVSVTPQDVGREVVLLFENGDPERPIILGLVQAEPVRTAEAMGRLARDARRSVQVDGQRVQIEAERELVLQCGKSSITLRSDGQIYVRGMKIVSRARGTHKIKGANVLIN